MLSGGHVFSLFGHPRMTPADRLREHFSIGEHASARTDPKEPPTRMEHRGDPKFPISRFFHCVSTPVRTTGVRGGDHLYRPYEAMLARSGSVLSYGPFGLGELYSSADV